MGEKQRMSASIRTYTQHRCCGVLCWGGEPFIMGPPTLRTLRQEGGPLMFPTVPGGGGSCIIDLKGDHYNIRSRAQRTIFTGGTSFTVTDTRTWTHQIGAFLEQK